MATAKKKTATKKVKTEEKSHLSTEAAAAKKRLEEAQADYAKILADERSDVIKDIKPKVKAYGIEAKHLFGSASSTDSSDHKYFDPKTGNSWSGKGRAKEPFQAIRHDEKALAKYLVEKKA